MKPAQELNRDRPEQSIGQGELAATRRAQIMDAGMAVVARQGVARTRLVDVADEAGVSVGMLQHYFRSREQLVRETFRAAEQDSLASLRRIAADEPRPFERLVAFLHWCATGRWPLWLEFWAASHRDDQLRGFSGEIYKEWMEPFREAITEGIALGMFHPSSPAADIAERLISQIDGLGIRLLLGHPGIDSRRMVDLLVDQLRLELAIDTSNE
jgi:AcrR family transcriptional regulator